MIAQFPLSGSEEPLMADHRYLVEGNYKIIYRVETKTVFIVRVFDARQAPEKLK